MTAEMTERIGIEKFKEGMRRLTGAVCLVTTCHDGRPYGLTATAVCSLSGAPPRLLTCVNVIGQTFRFILESRKMVVSVLAHSQMDTAKHFAGMGNQKDASPFSGSEWNATLSGTPYLRDALVAFECDVEEMVVTRSHGILIGEIMQIAFGPEAPPLLYQSGTFSTLLPAVA